MIVVMVALIVTVVVPVVFGFMLFLFFRGCRTLCGWRRWRCYIRPLWRWRRWSGGGCCDGQSVVADRDVDQVAGHYRGVRQQH